MAKARKPRSDSVHAQVQAAAEAGKPIKSIIKLNPIQKAAFDDIIAALPRDSWDNNSIRMAGKLAKLEVYFNELIDKVLAEGAVVENKRGTPVSNPAQTAMTTTASTVKMIRSTLGISASQRGTSKAATRPAMEREKKTRTALKAVGGKDLLA